MGLDPSPTRCAQIKSAHRTGVYAPVKESLTPALFGDCSKQTAAVALASLKHVRPVPAPILKIIRSGDHHPRPLARPRSNLEKSQTLFAATLMFRVEPGFINRIPFRRHTSSVCGPAGRSGWRFYRSIPGETRDWASSIHRMLLMPWCQSINIYGVHPGSINFSGVRRLDVYNMPIPRGSKMLLRRRIRKQTSCEVLHQIKHLLDEVLD